MPEAIAFDDLYQRTFARVYAYPGTASALRSRMRSPSLGAAVGLAIRALGVLLPRALVAALAWLAVSTFVRRRCEWALR